MANAKRSGKQKNKSAAADKAAQRASAAKSAKITKQSASPSAAKAAPGLSPARLRGWNRALAIIYALQGLAIITFSTTRTMPITTAFPGKDTIASHLADREVLGTAVRHLFDINLAYLVAAMFIVLAAVHLAASVGKSYYEEGLQNRTNPLRWAHYGLGAGGMLLIIALLSGITDISTLLLIVVLHAFATILRFVVEKNNSSWEYWLGGAACAAPWAVFVIYVGGALAYGGTIPTFVYWIYASMVVFFAAFAVNMYLQRIRRGSWANYVHSERFYIVLVAIATAALGWQVFAGALRG